jgi:hypothetical protein
VVGEGDGEDPCQGDFIGQTRKGTDENDKEDLPNSQHKVMNLKRAVTKWMEPTFDQDLFLNYIKKVFIKQNLFFEAGKI